MASYERYLSIAVLAAGFVLFACAALPAAAPDARRHGTARISAGTRGRFWRFRRWRARSTR